MTRARHDFPAKLPEPATPSREEAHRAKLIFVNRFFFPDGAATSLLLTDLVGELRAQGLPVSIVCSRERYDGGKGQLPARARYRGAAVHRVRTASFRRFGLLGRSIDDLTFYVAALFALLRLVRPGDVVVAKTDPPLIAIIALLAARLRGARLVNWCQDLFPEVAGALGVGVGGPLVHRTLRALRNTALRGAARNVVLSRGMASRLGAEGVEERRIAIIHNWADGEHVRPIPAEVNPLRHAWGHAGRFVLGYCGNLGRVHETDGLLALMEALADEADLRFVFVGGGEGYCRLGRAARARGLTNLEFRPYQPRRDLPHSLTLPDLHLVTLRPACEGLVMPSKLYGILAAGRPTLFLGDPAGDVARLLRQHDAGLIAGLDEIHAAAQKVRMLKRDRTRLIDLGANARRAYDRGLSRHASLAAWQQTLGSLLPLPASAPLHDLEPVPAE